MLRALVLARPPVASPVELSPCHPFTLSPRHPHPHPQKTRKVGKSESRKIMERRNGKTPAPFHPRTLSPCHLVTVSPRHSHPPTPQKLKKSRSREVVDSPNRHSRPFVSSRLRVDLSPQL